MITCDIFFFFLMIRRPPRSTPFPTRRSSDLLIGERPWAAINRPWARDHSCPGRTAAARATGVPRRARRCAGPLPARGGRRAHAATRARDRKSTRLNSSHGYISYAVFCLKKKKRDGSALIHSTLPLLGAI